MKQNKEKMIPYKDEGVIIVVSSIVSTFTYILVNSAFSHILHPAIFIILTISLVALFGFVLIFFRRNVVGGDRKFTNIKKKSA